MADVVNNGAIDKTKWGIEADKLNAKFNSIDSKLLNTNANITTVNGRLDGIDSDITTINGRLDGIDSDLTTVNGRLDGVDSDLANVNDSLANVNSDITTVNGRLDGIDSDITTIYNRLDGIDPDLTTVGIQFPTTGSQILSRTGNMSWVTNLKFLEDVALVLLDDALNETQVLATLGSPSIPQDAVLDGSSGQVMVRFKKFWYKDYFDLNGNLIEKRWSPSALPGYTLHPFFQWGEQTADYAYISRYEAGYDSGKLISASGVSPHTGASLSTFRSAATSRGAGWHSYDHWAQDLMQFYLYLVYASLDSQGVLPGYTNASAYLDAYKRQTGRSDGLLTISGSVDVDLADIDADLTGIVAEGKKIANSFLWIENFFGHIWKMCDGIAYDGRVGKQNTVWVSKNPAQYSSTESEILQNYEDLNLNLPPNDGYIGTVSSGFIPKDLTGSSSSHFGDYYYSSMDEESRDYLRLVRAGGYLYHSNYAGVAYRISNIILSFSNSYSGSRLCAKKF